MPRPTKEARAEARARITALKQTRDQAHADADAAKAEADEAMWRGIAAEIDQGHALQVDAATATGFHRDHILKRTKHLRARTRNDEG